MLSIEPTAQALGRVSVAKKMRLGGMADSQIQAFLSSYDKLLAGERGLLSARELQPVDKLLKLEHLAAHCDPLVLAKISRQVAILKLNGGLGTGMGLRGPKSLLPVRGGRTFLDIVIQQIAHLRQGLAHKFPLLLMNSYHTSVATRAALRHNSVLVEQAVPWELIQSRVPKISVSDYFPVSWEADSDLEWCPPGHGDVYLSLYRSGTLKMLLDRGFRYLFLSNIDNLGATVDLRIPAWMNKRGLSFVMETAQRCEADSKGGHLARLANRRLVLRERAMCPPDELDDFQDIQKYRYFNTNSLWVELTWLAKTLEKSGGWLYLPLIINSKRVDPLNEQSPEVFQLETAMGAAISYFEESSAVEVPRTRFAPVKSLSDLVAVRSDAYELASDYSVKLAAGRKKPPLVVFDGRVKQVKDLHRVFPYGLPSLVNCNHLEITGQVRFGRRNICRGDVHLDGSREPIQLADDEVLGA